MLKPEPQQSPSPEAVPPTVGESLSTSAPESDQSTEDRQSWWSRFLHTRGHHDTVPDADPADDQTPPATTTPGMVTLSEQELQDRINRQAQSLRDRQRYREQQEAAEAERKRLRDDDPWKYAQEEKQREDTEQVRQQQTAQLMTLLGHVGRQHDAATLDPLINALPEKERQRILELPNAGQGLPGRKVIVDEALKTYGRLEYERGYREAQTKLKKDPMFRKSVLAESRGRYDEPELFPGNGAPSDGLEDGNVSAILRRNYFQR